MPELPELEIVREVLDRRLRGRRIRSVTVDPKGGPIVLRNLTDLSFEEDLPGKSFESFRRRAKFLLISLQAPGLHLAINPKLTGRLQLCEPGAKKAGPVQVTFRVHELAEELRYVDTKRMGQLYLTRDLALVPGLSESGPEALEITPDEFRRSLRKFRGEVKGILTRGQFVAGIGNAYADEILWAAKIHPYRKRPSLSEEEVDRLYEAMVETLTQAIAQVREAMGEAIHLKPRDFFAVHMRGEENCPRCGTRISSITANQRITNFCRNCQPGGLFPGM